MILDEKIYGYDKVIMLAGGIGFARKEDSLKEEPEANQKDHRPWRR